MLQHFVVEAVPAVIMFQVPHAIRQQVDRHRETNSLTEGLSALVPVFAAIVDWINHMCFAAWQEYYWQKFYWLPQSDLSGYLTHPTLESCTLTEYTHPCLHDTTIDISSKRDSPDLD